LSDPSYEAKPAVSPARQPANWSLRIVALALGFAAVGLLGWYLTHRQTPTLVVERFCSALKGERWEQAYALIDWPDENHVDEKTFVANAKALRPLFLIQRYKLGEAKHEGDAAVVPVTVTITKTGLTGTEEVTAEVPVECRFKNGEWKVRPILRQLLSLGKGNLPVKK
jgi:hypothetical protein